MIVFRNLKKTTLYYWVVLLSVAIVAAQGVKLHVHGLGHEHDKQSHTNTSHTVSSHTATTDKHSHIHATHVSNAHSHEDSHDRAISEMDATPDGLLGKVFNLLLLVAIFVTAFILLKISFYQTRFRFRPEHLPTSSWQYHFSPPLRAPPH